MEITAVHLGWMLYGLTTALQPAALPALNTFHDSQRGSELRTVPQNRDVMPSRLSMGADLLAGLPQTAALHSAERRPTLQRPLRTPATAPEQRCRMVPQAQQHTDDTSSQHDEFDVSAAVVQPVFRSTPWDEEANKAAAGGSSARILFVSESNVCRSILAEATMRDLLEAHGMRDAVTCESRGSKDYNVGDPPDAMLQQVAAELELRLPEGAVARQFDHERDIVAFDLVLVMDKFCAADVLREVSVYDTINKAGNYTAKVRMLGQFHRQLGASKEPDGMDINDALYGNVGGPDEQEAVRRTAMIIAEACNGLLQFLQETQASAADSGIDFRQQLSQAVGDMGQIDWLVPPMLQK